MSAHDGWTPPPGLDVSKPSPARMYDYYLGGKDNFPADREAAEQVMRALPEIPQSARENRAFLVRLLGYLAGVLGIDQFVDIGTGIPTSPNAHEVARRHVPDAHVCYVDNDPVVGAHNRALRETYDGIVGISGDLREPQEIFAHPDFRRTIDLSRPIAVLCIAVFQFIPPELDPRVSTFLREAMASGSYLAISVPSADRKTHAEVERLLGPYEGSTAPANLRSRGQIAAILEGFELVDPGIVPASQWHPDLAPPPDDTGWLWTAVGRKP